METDELIGRSFGHYRIVKQLGEGGMAVVYQAEDSHLARLVAVKVLKVFLTGSAQEFGQRFEREALALARLQHPNIVQVLDYGSLDSRYPYLVMPFLSGGTLEDRVGSAMHYTRAAELLAPIADALAYAHRSGIIHRDVKPSNILLAESGRPMLSDFGIARMAEDASHAKLTATGSALGTPGYLAPEQWSGTSLPQTDIYSLGMVLYELITGHNPYTGDTPQVVLYKQMMTPLTAPRTLVTNLPVEVENALMKALFRAPEARYASMAEFAQVLQKIAANDLAGVNSLVGQMPTFTPDFPAIPGDAPTRPAESESLPAAKTPTPAPPVETSKVTILLNETIPVDSISVGNAPVGSTPPGLRPGKISDPSLLAEMKRTPTSLERPGGAPPKKSILPLVLLGLGSLALLAVAAIVLAVIFVPRLLGGQTAAQPTRTVVAGGKMTATENVLAAPTDAKAAPPVSGGLVTVTWLIRENAMLQRWADKKVIPAFEERHPNIQVNLVVIASAEDYDAQVQTMAAGGMPPDIWTPSGNVGFRDYVESGMVADLSPYISEGGMDLADFEPSTIQSFTIDGKLLAMPRSTFGSYLFFNKDLFDRLGVAYPTPDWDDTSWTWDAFLWKCRAMTSVHNDPNTDVFGCFVDLLPAEGIPLLWGRDLFPESAYATGFADRAFLDDPLSIEAFQARQDIAWNHNYMPNDQQGGSQGSGLSLFLDQKTAMLATGGWGWGALREQADFHWGVAALPYGSDGRRDMVFSEYWLLSNKSAHQREAWELLEWMSTVEMQDAWMEMSGTAPVRISLEEKWYGRFPDMNLDLAQMVHSGALRYGREYPGNLLVYYNQLSEIITPAADKIFKNEQSAAEALPAANQTLVESLRQIQTEFGH